MPDINPCIVSPGSTMASKKPVHQLRPIATHAPVTPAPLTYCHLPICLYSCMYICRYSYVSIWLHGDIAIHQCVSRGSHDTKKKAAHSRGSKPPASGVFSCHKKGQDRSLLVGTVQPVLDGSVQDLIGVVVRQVLRHVPPHVHRKHRVPSVPR